MNLLEKEQNLFNEADINLIEYILHIVRESRTKKRIEVRLQGLLRFRQERDSNCITYTKEMINDYISEKKENKPTNPPDPPYGKHRFRTAKNETKHKKTGIE